MPYKDPIKQAFATLTFKHKKLAWVAGLKMERGCDNCGWNLHPAALQYHHRDKKNKTQEINRMANKNSSKESILAEIKKCDLLCANCHAMQQSFTYIKYLGD